MKPLAIGSDDAGAPLRLALIEHLREMKIDYVDYGVDSADCLYPEMAFDVAQRVASREHDRAILICGTGIGMCISANKVPGVYAALAHDAYSAERARKSNNAQIITLGSRVIGPELAKAIIDVWLRSEFDESRSGHKIEKLRALEKEQR